MPISIDQSSLSPREKEVCDFVAQGLGNSEIGERMGISRGTVQVHVANIFRKTGAKNRTELALAWRKGRAA